MRGSNTVQPEQEDDQLKMAIDLLQERLFSLSCEEEKDSPGEAREESGSQTYAGVLRRKASPGRQEPDQLVKIRQLGTRGSMVQL